MTTKGWLWLTAAEVLLLVAFVTTGVQAARRLRRQGDRPERITGGFEDLLATVVPRRLARVMMLELHGWHALMRLPARWLRPPAPTEFSYAKELRVLMGALVALAVLEMPAITLLALLLLPWLAARVALLVIEVYALWFVLSLWAGMVTAPHAIRDRTLHIRAGLLAGVVIPLEDIAGVQAVRRSWSAILGPLLEEGVGAFPVNGSTELELRLGRRAVIWRVIGRDLSVDRVHVHADDPDRMLDALRTHLGEPAGKARAAAKPSPTGAGRA